MDTKKYNTYILTIERNKKRYQKTIKNLLKQNFNLNNINLFFGQDYKNIPTKILNTYRSKWGILCPNSVLCCAISHILLWKHISTTNDDYAIILEDDTYLTKEFFIFKNIIENEINDNTIVQLSDGVTISKFNQNSNNFFKNTVLVLSQDTYIINPVVAKKLFNYYKKMKISYHIDLHLSIIKNQMKLEIKHFKKKITNYVDRSESSMISSHNNNFFLKCIQGTEAYKNINTPIIKLGQSSINSYHITLFVIYIILIILCFYYNCKLHIFWFILGLGIYDIL